MKSKSIFLIVILTFSVNIVLHSEPTYEYDDGYLEPNEFLNPNNDKDLNFEFSATSFIKNDEYFNKFTQGTTAIGFFSEPKISYFITPRTKISGGVFLQKFFGKNDFTTVVPIFTIQHKITDDLDLILGRLHGTKSHLLEEPLFSNDRYIYNNLENGLQFKLRSSHLTSDVWVNWERFILKGDPYQEEFTFGTSTTLNIIGPGQIKLDLPIQSIITHKGGQIDESPLPVQSLFNASSGLRITYYDGGGHSISTEFLGFYYKGLSMPDYPQPNSQIYKEGWALYGKLKYQYKDLEVSTGFWYANKFIAPRGEALFQCVSNIDPTYSQDIRRLITAKVKYNSMIGNQFRMNLVGEYYWDYENSNQDFSLGFYLSVNEKFLLKKFKE